MKAWRKKLAGTFAAAVLTIACAAGSIVRAVQIETPDIDRSGSISIVMQDPETQNLARMRSLMSLLILRLQRPT